MISALIVWLRSLSLRQVIRFIGLAAAKIFWHLPAVMLIRLPIKLMKFMINPKNKMKTFILLTVCALAAMARVLIKKASDRRDRLSKRNVFQQFQCSAQCENDDLCVCIKCTEKIRYSKRKAAKDFFKRSWQKIRQTSASLG